MNKFTRSIISLGTSVLILISLYYTFFSPNKIPQFENILIFITWVFGIVHIISLMSSESTKIEALQKSGFDLDTLEVPKPIRTIEYLSKTIAVFIFAGFSWYFYAVIWLIICTGTVDMEMLRRKYR